MPYVSPPVKSNQTHPNTHTCTFLPFSESCELYFIPNPTLNPSIHSLATPSSKTKVVVSTSASKVCTCSMPATEFNEKLSTPCQRSIHFWIQATIIYTSYKVVIIFILSSENDHVVVALNMYRMFLVSRFFKSGRVL